VHESDDGEDVYKHQRLSLTIGDRAGWGVKSFQLGWARKANIITGPWVSIKLRNVSVRPVDLLAPLLLDWIGQIVTQSCDPG